MRSAFWFKKLCVRVNGLRSVEDDDDDDDAIRVYRSTCRHQMTPSCRGREAFVCVCVCFCRLLKEDQVQVMSTLFRSHGSRQQLGQWWRSWWWWLRLAFSSRPALNPRIGAKLSLSIHDSFLSFFLSLSYSIALFSRGLLFVMLASLLLLGFYAGVHPSL